MNTAQLYKQSKFQLFREEAEGYAKLITVLNNFGADPSPRLSPPQAHSASALRERTPRARSASALRERAPRAHSASAFCARPDAQGAADWR